MIDDRIGIIGNTQGVKLSNRPSTTNSGITVSSEPDFNAASILPSSDNVALPAADGLAGAAGAEALGVELPGAELIRPPPCPGVDIAASSSLAVCCVGG